MYTSFGETSVEKQIDWRNHGAKPFKSLLLHLMQADPHKFVGQKLFSSSSKEILNW